MDTQQKPIRKNTVKPKRGLAMFLMVVCCITISIGPLIFRNIENADIWQINIYRSVSWISALLIILLFKYRLSIISRITAIGRWGVIAGIFLASAQIFYMHALDNTSVANVVFILSAIPFVTAIIAYLFIKEKIQFATVLMMAFAAVGIFIMVSEGVNSGNAFGNIMAIITLLCFSCFPVILRNNRHIDMLPTLLVPALIIGIVGLIVKGSEIQISSNDILLSFIWGGLLNGFAHSIFIIATRHLLAAEITLFMLLEFSLGPLWVWFFIGEMPASNTIVGGSIVMSAIALLTFYELLKRQKLNTIIKEIGWNENEYDKQNIKDNNISKSMIEFPNDNISSQDRNEIKNSDERINEKIAHEVEKLLIPSLNNWMDKNLKKVLQKNIKDQINEIKNSNTKNAK